MPTDVAEGASGVLTVWSDIGCPWATLALHTVREAARRVGAELFVDHRAFPLELFNRRPTPKPVIDAEVVAIAGLRPGLGWRPWTQSERSYPVSTLLALEAVQAAKTRAVGGLAASDELDEALREAFYVEHRCISNHTEVLDVARRCGSVNLRALAEALEAGGHRSDVFDQWRTARDVPVTGSPHLFAEGLPLEGLHNPGVTYHWTSPPDDGGVPRFETYDDGWATSLIAALQPGARRYESLS